MSSTRSDAPITKPTNAHKQPCEPHKSRKHCCWCDTGDVSNLKKKTPLESHHIPLAPSLLRRRGTRISWGGLAGILRRGRGASVPPLCTGAARGFRARRRRPRQKIAELLHERLRWQPAFYPLQLLALLEEDQGRQPGDVELGHQLRVLVGIDLDHERVEGRGGESGGVRRWFLLGAWRFLKQMKG